MLDDAEYIDQLEYYEKWIASNHPYHDRTSCNDVNLFNAGFVTLRYRCERCETLMQLRAWKNAQLLTHLLSLKGQQNA